MKRYITMLLLLMTLAPAAAIAQDRDDTGRGGDEDGWEYDLSDYVLERGDFRPDTTPATTGVEESGKSVEQLITEACGEGDVVIVYDDDGSISDWDCD